MRLFSRSAFLLAAFAAAGANRPLFALSDAEAAAGRSLSQRYGAAIVTVELVASIDIRIGEHPAPRRQVRLEANGTVISPQGLTVASMIEIDPRRTAEAATRNLTISGGQQVQIGETEFSEVKLRLGDGTEVPAAILREDADLDLAFLLPVPAPAGEKPAPRSVFACVRLDNAASPAVLADYFIVSRAPKSLQRVSEIHLSTIEGIVEGPQRMFIPNGFVTGCPMLDPSGRLLGLCLTQMVDGHPLLAGGRPSGIIVPAESVAAKAREALAEVAGR